MQIEDRNHTSLSTIRMKTRRRISWLGLCIILDIVHVGSSSPSMLEFTWSKVGLDTVLPCKWDLHTGVSSEYPYIQWQTPSVMVFERMGTEHFQAEAYHDRANVPESMLATGNCSLLLSDVRFSDAGIYESYMVERTTNTKRIFIQRVQLLVNDHKSMQSVEKGDHLTLELYTHQAETVAFQGSAEHEWNLLWQRERSGDKVSTRVEEKDGKLIIKSMEANDEGIYKVMDGDGLALSTVKVLVKEPAVLTEVIGTKRISLDSSVATNYSSLYTFVFLLLLLFL